VTPVSPVKGIVKRYSLICFFFNDTFWYTDLGRKNSHFNVAFATLIEFLSLSANSVNSGNDPFSRPRADLFSGGY
jgi:hypothetical protein